MSDQPVLYLLYEIAQLWIPQTHQVGACSGENDTTTRWWTCGLMSTLYVSLACRLGRNTGFCHVDGHGRLPHECL